MYMLETAPAPETAETENPWKLQDVAAMYNGVIETAFDTPTGEDYGRLSKEQQQRLKITGALAVQGAVDGIRQAVANYVLDGDHENAQLLAKYTRPAMVEYAGEVLGIFPTQEHPREM